MAQPSAERGQSLLPLWSSHYCLGLYRPVASHAVHPITHGHVMGSDAMLQISQLANFLLA